VESTLEDTLTSSKVYKTLFQNGLELPQSSELHDSISDSLWLNLLLCMLVAAGIVLGIIYDIRALYPAAGCYVIQFLEYCCSNTRVNINNIENLD
jgi:hypothetical protein